MNAAPVSVVNLGCRVNRAETDQIAAGLAEAGFRVVEPDEAELIVINTCAVTGEAEAKTRKAVRHALARPRRPLVIATGCAANLDPEALRALSDRVTVETMKTSVVARAEELLGGARPPKPAAGVRHAAPRVSDRARVGVKIQDGCNHRCTYCIVWKARGSERSVPADEVLDRVRALVAAGIPEVVLTGVNLGAYRDEGPRGTVEIDGLLGRILDETDVAHVRLSSVEPMDATEALIERMASAPGRVAPFLHLPIQAGCTETLRRMGRPYTAGDLARIAARIRALLPQVALSCDVIAGFPGETDAEFARTRALIEELGFARMHVFRYSPRPGTVAASAPDQVPPAVKDARARELRDLAARMARADARGRVGTVERAVIETGRRGTLGSFHRVVVDDAPVDGAPRLVEVGIMGMDGEGTLHARIDEARKGA